MINFKEIAFTKAESIITITLNNPKKRNALSPIMLSEIREALTQEKLIEGTRCAIIKGTGNNIFSSGYDITSIRDDDMMREFRKGHPLEECLGVIEDFPYPVIAMMNGHTLGAGLELAVTCDIRVCVNTAKMGIPPAKLGLVYSYSGTKKFLNLIGIANTKELFLTGNTINAARAEEIGLVNYIISKNEIEKFTNNLAAEISHNAPLSLSTMKKLINIWQRNQDIKPEDEKLIKKLFQKVQNSKDYKEGKSAFEEGRKPIFKRE